MKRFPKAELFSLFSIIFGIMGLALQNWLFSAADRQGLLPRDHIAEILSFVLLGIVAVVNYIFLRIVQPSREYSQIFPQSSIAAIGCFLSAAGLLYSTFTTEIGGVLRLLVYLFGILSGLALGFSGYCRLRGQLPNCLLYAVIAVFLIFRTLAFCQVWSAEVQVQLFVFPVLSSLSLLLTAYFRAALGADMGNCRHYLFFRQLALFCCLMSATGEHWPFFLSCAIWLAADFCAPAFVGKYA